MSYHGPMHATPEGTRSYFSRHPVLPVPLGRTGLQVSPVGFGCYRVHDGSATHREALRAALLSGCNLIDTSTNYGDGASERLVGRVLGELFSEGKLARGEVVVVSKAGYVQGGNLELARGRKREGRPFPELVELSEDCWHCISPEFLEDQVGRSLERLGLGTIDVLLLHNPEYFLKAGGDHAAYYDRIARGLAQLEKEVARGRIRRYGISSNAFPEERGSPEYTSLETVLESAGAGFTVIQFPFNLFEPGAAFEPSNSGRTVAELARARGLGTLVNRPLNSFAGGRLVRLADFAEPREPSTVSDLERAFEGAMALESRYPGKSTYPVGQLAWGHILRQNLSQVLELDAWRQVLAHQILPSLEDGLSRLEAASEAEAAWARSYREASGLLTSTLTAFLTARAASRSRAISSALDEACPALRSSRTLSRKAIRVLRSVPGIDCVLVGMRRPDYVRDALLGLEPPLEAEQAIDALEAAQGLLERGALEEGADEE